MHGAELGAAMQRRHRFTGIEQTFLIKRLFDRMKLVQFIRTELNAHMVDFFDADTMLAGDRTADLDTEFQYLST